MTRIYSFAPVSRADATVLVLGSIPGAASLAAGQYYAHPRNQFWPVMGRLAGAGPDIPYAQRLEILKENRIALWDVLEGCIRPGSLDSAIREEKPNDFRAFFASHPDLARVYFNGAKAAALFRRHVLKAGIGAGLTLVTLPSTSPANASWPFDRKCAAWLDMMKKE